MSDTKARMDTSSSDPDDIQLSSPPKSLHTAVSPPPIRRRKQITTIENDSATPKPTSLPVSSDVEAGTAKVTDHLTYWTKQLLPHSSGSPPLAFSALYALYTGCAGQETGNHYVIHQLDHPVACLHYDLRVQINETSSASWAVMFGMPGNAQSRRINRNATETRVHCLWVGGCQQSPFICVRSTQLTGAQEPFD